MQPLPEGEFAGNDPIDSYLKLFPFALAHNLAFHAKNISQVTTEIREDFQMRRHHCNSSLLSAERCGWMLINEPRSGTQQEWAAIICNTVLPGISEWRSEGRQSELITMKEQTFDLCSASFCPLFVSLRKHANPAGTGCSIWLFQVLVIIMGL